MLALARLLRLARAPVELAEAEVTVGHEGAHAELIGQDQRLAVVAVRRRFVRRCMMGGDLAQELEGMRLLSAFPLPAGDIEREKSPCEGGFGAFIQQIRLAQKTHKEGVVADQDLGGQIQGHRLFQ